MSESPWFVWSGYDELTEDELREKLRSDDPWVRGTWAGRIMREATWREVWLFLKLDDVLRDWPYIERNLGRARPFWEWLFESWRRDGLLAR